MSTMAAALRDALTELFLPIVAAARYPAGWRGLLASLGHPDSVANDAGLRAALERVASVVESISVIDDEMLQTWEGLQQVLRIGSEANDALRALQQAAANPALADRLQDFGQNLIEFLVTQYLRNNHRVLFRVSSALTVITPAELSPVEPAEFDGSEVTRMPWRRSQLRPGRVKELLSSPWETLLESYFQHNLATAGDAHQSAALLFPQLGALADSLGLWWRSDLVGASPEPSEAVLPDDPGLELDHFAGPDDEPPDVDVPLPQPTDPAAYYRTKLPRFLFAIPASDGGTDPRFAIALLFSSAEHPGGVAGLIITPISTFTSVETHGRWRITINSTGQIPALAAGPGGFSLATSNPSASGSVDLLVERIPEEGTSGPAFLLGATEGTRLELGLVRLPVSLSLDTDKPRASIGLDATSGVLVIKPGDSDSFLKAVLPADGLRAEFDVGIELSSTAGLTLHGSAGLEATVPIDRSVGGVTLSTLYLALRAGDEGVTAEVSATINAAIGPVQVAIDRMGLAAAVGFPETGGNLGVADLDFRFKPPSGLGLSIDASAVVGGGFLGFYPEKGEYTGMLQLEIVNRINVKAFGILSTRLPDGSRGYSLIIFVTAEGFQPIQLGMGFKLEGIGGMIAINRTFNEVAMRDGLKNGTLGTLLFPVDPIRNAPEILRNLATVFPAKTGSYLFGPMVKIGWATPTLIQMDLALILEFGSRRRLIVLGRISSILPSRDKDLIRLNMDAMGILDFDAGTVSMDAVLVDSRLLQKFVLTGSMAMRACVVPGRAGFALAVGGMNPHYSPPDAMPRLERIAINLTSGNNPRFTCDAYFAVTANTIQFGSRSAMYAAAYGFSIEGDVGFDVLIQLLPFHFLADFEASIQLKRGSHNLFKVKVNGALEGPRPLRVSAKATFEILWCDFSIHFDKTLIEGEKPEPPAAVNALEELRRALSLPEAWNADLPAARRHGVTMRKLPGDATLTLDPLGQLTVRQTVLPLNTSRDMDVFGGAPLDGDRRFTITEATLNATAQSVGFSRDLFAPAQFFDLSDDDKLASPSFEEMDSGVVFGSDVVVFEENSSQRVYAPLEYDTIIIDEAGEETAPAEKYVLGAKRLRQQLGFASVARSAARNTGLDRFRNTEAAPAVTIAKPRWTIASTTDLDVLAPNADEGGMSWGDARARLKELNHDEPDSTEKWQLIPHHETVP